MFRAVAIVLIVATHSIPSLDWSASPIGGRILDVLCNETSILFTFISGYLFQHLLSKYRLGTYYRAKLTNVIVPYVIVSIPALIVFTGWLKREDIWDWFYQEPIHNQIFLFLITGKHLAPLWFIPTIALFYVAAPLLAWGDRRGHLYYALFGLILLSAYLGRGGEYGPLNKAMYLAPAYLFGMLLSHHRERAMELSRRFWWVLAGLATASFWWAAADAPTPPYPQIILKLALAPLFVMGCDRIVHRIGGRLDYVAQVSMSIFLIHAYFINALKIAAAYIMTGTLYQGVDPYLAPGNLLTFSLYTTVVMLSCLAAIRVGQTILGKWSRFVIGA